MILLLLIAAIGTAPLADTPDRLCVPSVPATDPHRIPLQPTPAGKGLSGSVRITFAESPFVVSVSTDGDLAYDLAGAAEGLPRKPGVTYVAWIATPKLDRFQRLGLVGDDGTFSGRADWSKFIVIVSAETNPQSETPSRDILLTGISPSGWLQSFAGHGIFGTDAC